MNRRTLGRTGLEISEIGFGSWGLGKAQWIGANDDESVRALRRAFDLGLNFVDTALAYGDGHSESVVGRAVREQEGIAVATKIPPKNHQWPARGDVPVDQVFPANYVVSSTEQSLKHLGMQTIDLQQYHLWTDELIGRGDWLAAVERLKK